MASFLKQSKNTNTPNFLVSKLLSGSKGKNIEAKPEEGSEKYAFIIIKRQQHDKAVFDNSTTTIFEKVKKKYAICIISVSLTDLQEPSSVSASMVYHFKPNNDSVCILGVYMHFIQPQCLNTV
jgi:hypothetical protein